MRRKSLLSLTIAALGVAGAAALAYGALVERRLWRVRRVELPVLAPESEPLRLLHISDLHMLPGQRDKQEWVAALAGLDPDLVIVTGDNLASPDAIPGVLAALTPLLRFPGAFVFGSNDYYAPVMKNPLGYFSHPRPHSLGMELPWRELRQALLDGGWIDATHRRALITAGGRRIEVAGVDDPHLERDDYSSIAGPLDPEGDLHLGLVHSPEPRVLDAFAADGFDLLLAGHTHGGQVCLPGYGALVTNCGLPNEYAKGLHRWSDSTWLNVSAGLGTSPYFPVRFACPPEVSVVTLVGAPVSGATAPVNADAVG